MLQIFNQPIIVQEKLTALSQQICQVLCVGTGVENNFSCLSQFIPIQSKLSSEHTPAQLWPACEVNRKWNGIPSSALFLVWD